MTSRPTSAPPSKVRAERIAEVVSLLAAGVKQRPSRESAANESTSAFEERGVSPDAVELSDAFACADDPEPASLMEGDACGVLGKDPGLDRPDPGCFG